MTRLHDVRNDERYVNRMRATLRACLLRGALILALGAAGTGSAAAEKTDIVFLANGDRITCEIKKLERGRLSVSTDAMGTLSIDWQDVAVVVAKEQFEVELDDGEKFFGSFVEADEERTLAIRGDDSLEVPLPRVVKLTQIEETLWGKIDGSFSLGLNFTQASDTTQFSFGSSFRLRTRRTERRITVSSLVDDRGDASSTSRQDLSFSFNRYFPNRQFTWSLGQAQSNEELGLDLRLLASGGYGRTFVQTNQSLFWGGLGLAATLEEVSGSRERQESFEGVLTLSFARFLFDDPEVDLDTSLIVYPSLSRSRRIRAELQARLRRELVEDFYLNLTLLNSYDSEPPSADAEENDLALITSLGWSF